MKLTLLQENLNKTLSIVTKAIPSKPSLPILSSIKLSAEGTTCTACATDLYFGVDTKIIANVEETGSVVIPGKQFKEIIGSLSPGVITIELQEGTLSIRAGKSITKLQCQSSEDYPPFPEVTGTEVEIQTELLSNIEALVAFAASSDVARPVLTSILFDIEEAKPRVVATDGFRLAVLEVPGGIKTEKSLKMLLPAKAVIEVARLAQLQDKKSILCTVSEELKQVLFTIGDVLIYVRLIEGTYPPYEKIMPSTYTTAVEIDQDELQAHMKRALVFARESSNIIKFSIQENTVQLGATSALVGTYEGVLEQVRVSGDSLEIAFNSKYVQEFLGASKSGQVRMELTESLKPVVFTTPDLPLYRYIVMPFKVVT